MDLHGAFHVYATSDDWGDGAGARLLPHFRSFDLVEWEYVGDAFSSYPSWAPWISFLWAPDVHVTGDGAVMYYSTGGTAPCIGRASRMPPASTARAAEISDHQKPGIARAQ